MDHSTPFVVETIIIFLAWVLVYLISCQVLLLLYVAFSRVELYNNLDAYGGIIHVDILHNFVPFIVLPF